MAENEEDYDLVREVLDVGADSRKKELEAIAALERIRRSREEELRRAERDARAAAVDEFEKLLQGEIDELDRTLRDANGVARKLGHNVSGAPPRSHAAQVGRLKNLLTKVGAARARLHG